MSDQDPIRWADAPDRAPPGAAELVRSIDAPPPLPPDLSRLVIARARPPAWRRWVGPSLAAAVILGGIVLWRFGPIDREEPVAIATLDEPARMPTSVQTPSEVEPAPIGAADVEAADVEAADVEAARPPEAESPSRERPRPRWREPRPRPHPRDTSVAQRNGERAVGYLTIQTIPWARVFVDGRDTGRNTPIRSLRVPVGRHAIGLRTNDGVMHTVQVTIEPDTTVRIVRQL